jgi:hypothetical protein
MKCSGEPDVVSESSPAIWHKFLQASRLRLANFLRISGYFRFRRVENAIRNNPCKLKTQRYNLKTGAEVVS